LTGTQCRIEAETASVARIATTNLWNGIFVIPQPESDGIDVREKQANFYPQTVIFRHCQERSVPKVLLSEKTHGRDAKAHQDFLSRGLTGGCKRLPAGANGARNGPRSSGFRERELAKVLHVVRVLGRLRQRDRVSGQHLAQHALTSAVHSGKDARMFSVRRVDGILGA